MQGSKRAPGLIVRVLPDVVTLDKAFDYAVPDRWHADGRADRLAAGSIVRIDLGGRRVRGWVIEIGVEPVEGVTLLPVRKLTGMGPPADLIDLASWAAWRWAGRRVSLLRTASPRRVVPRLPPHGAVGDDSAVDGLAAVGVAANESSALGDDSAVDGLAAVGVAANESSALGDDSAVDGLAAVGVAANESSALGDDSAVDGLAAVGVAANESSALGDVFERPGSVTVLRRPPADDGLEVALAAARRGDALIVVAAASAARRLAGGLRRAGVRVALGFDDWAEAAAGATVVGTRTAAWLPMPRLSCVVVFDEHDEALQEQSAPTWHARDVALERAQRAGAPAVLVSPVPSLEALEAGALQVPERAAERRGWPAVTVLDRRQCDPVRAGLFLEGFGRFLDASRHPGRFVAVLNRKGRSRLLACRACGELVCTADGRQPMILADRELVARDGSERRPAVCARCGSTVLRNLRTGVTRAREELEALAGEPVGEVTAGTAAVPRERVVIGTEAVLWRLGAAGVVAFLDFDQELLAPRQRAAPQALALLARAARLLGRADRSLRGMPGRRMPVRCTQDRAAGRLVIQTSQPGHLVIQAAARADPSIVTDSERERRRSMGLPPFSAQARISGAGAADFVEALDRGTVAVRGPADGKYLLRAPSHAVLLDELARTPRGRQRLRIEVDPLRI